MKLKNIIFVALTTYQLYVSDSYSKYIKEHYPDKNVHIICVGLERDNYTPPQEVDLIMLPNMNKTVFNRVIQRLVYGGRFFFLTSLKQIVRSSHTILFVFNDNEPITNKLVREVKKIRNNKVAIIEEGIGIYSHSNNNKLTIKQQIRYFFTSILGSPMQYKAIGDNPNINYAIVGNKNLYETLEKSRGQNVFAQNKNLLFSSTEDFLKRYLGTSFSYQRADIIYLGQPFDEYGKMLPDEEKCLEELFSLVEENKTILIKPHHFIDIFKLYGSGIDRFVPDEKMGHDFYKVANEIIDNPSIDLKLTIGGDDICKPCKKYHEQCIDPLTHIQGYTSKDVYNKTLDKRIIKLYNLNDEYYTAKQLCSIIQNNKEYIFEVWDEEDNEVTQKRYELFLQGAHKFLDNI